MTATITATAAAAAGRARDLSELIAQRAALHPAREVMAELVGHLLTAAEAFENEPMPYTNVTPAVAGFALVDFLATAKANPQAGIPGEVAFYVTAPISRRLPELEQLNPVSAQLAGQEASLRTRIGLAADALRTSTDEDSRQAALEALLNLHRMFDRLAASVAVDNARPCNRR